jgi:hypothetical protein
MDTMDRKQEILILIDALVLKTKERMTSDIKMSAGDVVEITLYVMLLVERSPNTLSSEDKLHIATETIYKTLDLLPDLSESSKNEMKLLIPNAIETIIAASKGEFSFGKPSNPDGKKVDTVKLAQKLYDRIAKFIKDEKFTADTITLNIFIIVAQLMSMIEEYPSLTGIEKKIVVLEIMKKIEKDILDFYPDMTIQQRQALKLSLMLLPSLIDKLVATASGAIDLNQIKENSVKCWGGIKNLFNKIKCTK